MAKRKPLTDKHKKKISLALKGKKKPPRTAEHIEKIASSHRGKTASLETRRKLSIAHKGDNHLRGTHRSEATKKKLSLYWGGYRWGDRHHNWKGGIYPLVKLVRDCFKTRQWRSDVFTRDDFTCQFCGVRGGTLHAHHIKRFSVIFKENKIKTYENALDCEELWNINNGQTLCKSCHSQIGELENARRIQANTR